MNEGIAVQIRIGRELLKMTLQAASDGVFSVSGWGFTTHRRISPARPPVLRGHEVEFRVSSVTTASPLRWTMIALAFFATAINYLDRQALSVAAPILLLQFHLSNIVYSRILFGFMLAYTIMNGVSGRLIDRLGTRIGYALFVAWWSCCAVLHVFVRGALSLGVLRFLLGVGEAGNWPGAVKVVAEWFPVEERSLASGIFNSGSAVGAILAPPIVAFILLRYGWRSAFLVVGCLGFVWLVAWMKLYRPPTRPLDEPALRPLPMRQLLRSRFVWSFTLSKVFIDPVWYFYTFWFPEYLTHARHFNMSSIGHYAWIPFFVAGLGSAGGGFISTILLGWGMSVTSARKSAVTFSALLMAMAIPAVMVGSSALSIAFCLDRDGRLYSRTCKYAGDAGRCVLHRSSRVSIWSRQHGFRIWRDGFYADYGVARRPLLVCPRLPALWPDPFYLRLCPLDSHGPAHTVSTFKSGGSFVMIMSNSRPLPLQTSITPDLLE